MLAMPSIISTKFDEKPIFAIKIPRSATPGKYGLTSDEPGLFMSGYKEPDIKKLSAIAICWSKSHLFIWPNDVNKTNKKNKTNKANKYVFIFLDKFFINTIKTPLNIDS